MRPLSRPTPHPPGTRAHIRTRPHGTSLQEARAKDLEARLEEVQRELEEAEAMATEAVVMLEAEQKERERLKNQASLLR